MSNNQPVYLTEEGLQKVHDELTYLTARAAAKSRT